MHQEFLGQPGGDGVGEGAQVLGGDWYLMAVDVQVGAVVLTAPAVLVGFLVAGQEVCRVKPERGQLECPGHLVEPAERVSCYAEKLAGGQFGEVGEVGQFQG